MRVTKLSSLLLSRLPRTSTHINRPLLSTRVISPSWVTFRPNFIPPLRGMEMTGEDISRNSQKDHGHGPFTRAFFVSSCFSSCRMVKILYHLTEREEIMIANIFQRKSVMAMLLVVLLGVAWMGCSTTVKERQQGQPVTGPTRDTKAEEEWVGKYYLDDVRRSREIGGRL